MLLIETYLSADEYSGIGLFAAEDIPKNTRVWQWDDFVDKVFKKTEFDQLPELFKKYLYKYGYSPSVEVFGEEVVCYNMDDGRFFNHSNEPNTTEIENGIIIANREIKKGEQLTCNYSIIDDKKQFCGSFLK